MQNLEDLFNRKCVWVGKRCGRMRCSGVGVLLEIVESMMESHKEVEAWFGGQGAPVRQPGSKILFCGNIFCENREQNVNSILEIILPFVRGVLLDICVKKTFHSLIVASPR